ncbi:hypothetical protein GGI17_006527 [Coemansia sp. S146]|nr:hypothetical protein GGI17_006527 [Coemansia sp. S146]
MPRMWLDITSALHNELPPSNDQSAEAVLLSSSSEQSAQLVTATVPTEFATKASNLTSDIPTTAPFVTEVSKDFGDNVSTSKDPAHDKQKMEPVSDVSMVILPVAETKSVDTDDVLTSMDPASGGQPAEPDSVTFTTVWPVIKTSNVSANQVSAIAPHASCKQDAELVSAGMSMLAHINAQPSHGIIGPATDDGDTQHAKSCVGDKAKVRALKISTKKDSVVNTSSSNSSSHKVTATVSATQSVELVSSVSTPMPLPIAAEVKSKAEKKDSAGVSHDEPSSSSKQPMEQISADGTTEEAADISNIVKTEHPMKLVQTINVPEQLKETSADDGTTMLAPATAKASQDVSSLVVNDTTKLSSASHLGNKVDAEAATGQQMSATDMLMHEVRPLDTDTEMCEVVPLTDGDIMQDAELPCSTSALHVVELPSADMEMEAVHPPVVELEMEDAELLTTDVNMDTVEQSAIDCSTQQEVMPVKGRKSARILVSIRAMHHSLAQALSHIPLARPTQNLCPISAIDLMKQCGNTGTANNTIPSDSPGDGALPLNPMCSGLDITPPSKFVHTGLNASTQDMMNKSLDRLFEEQNRLNSIPAPTTIDAFTGAVAAAAVPGVNQPLEYLNGGLLLVPDSLYYPWLNTGISGNMVLTPSYGGLTVKKVEDSAYGLPHAEREQFSNQANEAGTAINTMPPTVSTAPTAPTANADTEKPDGGSGTAPKDDTAVPDMPQSKCTDRGKGKRARVKA